MTLFKERKVAMIINGPWEVNNIKSATTFGGLENLGIAPVPAGSGEGRRPGRRPQLRRSGPACRQEKAAGAIAFIKFMNYAESQAFLADKLGLLPTRKSAYDVRQGEEQRDHHARSSR